MDYANFEALAAEYRRRGWHHIAEAIEYLEKEPDADQLTLYFTDGNDFAEEARVTDAYRYFRHVLETAAEYGEAGDAMMSLYDEACRDALLGEWEPERKNIH